MFQNTRQHNAANHLTCITIHLNKKIAGSIRSNTELEVEQNEIGSGVAAIMTTYGFGLGDPVLELNINPSNDWKGLSNNDLDSLLLHKIIHEAANTDDNGTLDYNDTHFIDSLTTNLCKEPVIRSWMPRSVKDCCCPK